MHIVTGTTNTTPKSLVEGKSDRHWKPWNISDKLIGFLGVQESGVLNGRNFQHHEVTDGLILEVYLDSNLLPTVGKGHLILPEDKLRLGDTISLDRARNFAKQDLLGIESAVNRQVKVPLYQHEYDALVSIIFNCGAGNGAVEIVKFINSGNYIETPSFIETYRPRNNKRRRKQEAAMFKEGNYDARH